MFKYFFFILFFIFFLIFFFFSCYKCNRIKYVIIIIFKYINTVCICILSNLIYLTVYIFNNVFFNEYYLNFLSYFYIVVIISVYIYYIIY